jgi:broad specificity phosphatase PhoE
LTPAPGLRPGSPPARLILIRHGRTAWNAEGRFQGHADVPLDAVGRQQAGRVADEVTALSPDLVACSDLLRARATATPLAERSGVALVVDRALREIDVGAWQGLTAADVAARFPEEYREWEAGRLARRGGGESEAEAGARAATSIRGRLASLVPLHAAPRVPQAGAAPAAVQATGPALAVVAHGVVLRAAIHALVGAGVVELPGPAPHLGNGAWLVLEARSS